MMKILIYSPAFFPSLGGLEMMVFLIARELSMRSHDVIVYTSTAAATSDEYNFRVVRAGNGGALLRAVRWSDVYLQFNVSLKGIWPLLIFPRRLVVSHHGIYARADGSVGIRDVLKYQVAGRAVNIALSRYVADHLQKDVTVIPDAYDDSVFSLNEAAVRDRDLVFVGRLVSDKGVDDLLYALEDLRRRGLTPRLSIVGDGPERTSLEALAVSLGLTAQVDFVGVLRGPELAAALNSHRVLVVPSRWAEPFGLVALEGIACGCVVVGSELGGLPEAIGPCGVTYPNGNRAALANRIGEVLLNPRLYADLRSNAAIHLQRHRPEVIASKFEGVLLRAASC